MNKLQALQVHQLPIVNLGGLSNETIIAANTALSALGQLGTVALNSLIVADGAFRENLITERGSLITEQIHEMDKLRDGGLSEAIRTSNTAAKSSNPTNANAGKILTKFLEPYHETQKEPLMSETSTLNYLRNKYHADPEVQNAAVILQLDPVFMSIFNANDQVSILWNQRAEEEAAKSKPSPSSLRGNLEKSYTNFCNVVLQTLNLMPSPQLESLFYVMNEIRIKYTRFLPARLNDTNTSVSSIPVQKYTGKRITPIPTVLFGADDGILTELVFTVDFYVTYRNNINVGEAKIIVHGKGKYAGSYVSTFHIEN
jgi:hypothetical protein